MTPPTAPLRSPVSRAPGSILGTSQNSVFVVCWRIEKDRAVCVCVPLPVCCILTVLAEPPPALHITHYFPSAEITPLNLQAKLQHARCKYSDARVQLDIDNQFILDEHLCSPRHWGRSWDQLRRCARQFCDIHPRKIILRVSPVSWLTESDKHWQTVEW